MSIASANQCVVASNCLYNPGMLRSTPEWQQYELDQVRHGPKGYVNNIAVVNAMARHVQAMGKDPLRTNPLVGLDDEIRLAKALNVRLHVR